MRNIKEKASVATLARLLWLFMFIVLIASPLFPGRRTMGFYSVEWSFFFFVFFLMFFFLLTWGMGEFTPIWDDFYKLFIIYWILGLISVVFAFNKVRGILFWGQYIPYFFVLMLCVSLIRTEKLLDNFINKLTYLALTFSLIVIASFAIYHDRGALNDFLINNFEIAVNKILPYLELPFCIVIYRMIAGNKYKFDVLILFIVVIVVIISGSRGSFLILIGIIGLAIIKSKKFGKAFLVGSLAALLIMAALLITPYTAERFDKLFSASESLNKENAESISRIYTALVAYQIMVDNPIIGIGMGNVSQYSETALKKLNVPVQVRQFWEYAHLFETTCTPLKMGAEIGIIGFAFFFVWYFALWRRVRIAQKNKSGKQLQTLMGLEIYVIGSFVHNFVDLGFYQYYSWIYYGVVLAATRIYKDAPKYQRGLKHK